LPVVSFIIAARDEDAGLLTATLDGLRATTHHISSEIIVVDDGSRTPVEHPGGDVRVLRNPQPLGVSPARRLGAQSARGQVLVWLDAHMSFGDWWLEQMLVHADTGALLCSPFCSYDLRDCLCWGARFVWNPVRDYSQQKHPGFTFVHCTEPPAGQAPEVPMVIGACYMMARDAYARMGGFSPYLRVWGGDEQDMSARAWITGAGVRCVASAKVGHLYRSSFPYPVQFEHVEFNQLMMIRGLFQQETVTRLERYFDPMPAKVAEWAAGTDLGSWRASVQKARRMTDSAFFERFLPELV
jgi:glycosyltransferase involved in cell wall biosynthesis